MQVTVNPYAINGVVGSKKNTSSFFDDYLGDTNSFNQTEMDIDVYEKNVTGILQRYGDRLQGKGSYGNYLLYNWVERGANIAP